MTDIDNSELKCCPCCGGEAKLCGDECSYENYIECTVCGLSTDYLPTLQVIKAWNTRISDMQEDWTEDFEHENGNYSHICWQCGKHFIGHKRRVVCKRCFSFNKEKR